MAAKQLLFGQDARDSMRRGVDALPGAVKVALGPRGRTVILEHEFGPPRIVDSGVVVAGSVELEERAAVEEGIVAGGGVALLRARMQGMTLSSLDRDSGLRIAARVLEEPLRRIVGNAAEEPSIVLHRADETGAPTQEVPAATGVGAQPQLY